MIELKKNNRCFDCGKIIDHRSKRCQSCARKGKLNPMFGRTEEKGPMFGKKGNKHPNFKGGKTKNNFGYIFVLQPEHPLAYENGYVPEHRLMMEISLGRYLTQKEEVHHKNGKRDDNRLDNLFLCVDKAEHTRIRHIIRKSTLCPWEKM